MWTVSLLGPVEVRRDGALVTLPAGKTTEVLVRLALDAGRPVRAERLIEELWADRAAGTGRNTLQSKVSQLRRAVGAPELVAARTGGYALALAADRVDALRVVDLAAASSAAARAGDAAVALEAARAGLVLFRGEVLADVGDGTWVQPHRTRLEEVRLGLLEDELAARVELGAGSDVIGRIESLVEEHPLRERLWVCLVTALYRAGRQADALAAYARVRRLLVEQLGIEPGPDLQTLERQVLLQSPDLLPGRPDPLSPTGDAPGRVVAPAAGNLPALSSPIVGRAQDVDAVSALARERRLVTVVGTAGVGKSRTALEVARSLEAAGGVWLVRVDAADPTTSIRRLVAETLHLPGGDALLEARLRDAPTVLVLDGCEHVVDAVADLAGRLLDDAEGLRVLATSQVPMGLDGEMVYPLEPLPIEASVALFAARAAQLRRQFVLDGTTSAVVEEVCRSLDGLPLAIELAAARVRSLSVQEIARRLDDRFTLLQDPTSRRPDRRRALSAAIGWSYDLLFPDDQRGLWALACFSGGAPLQAAEHVLAALDVPSASAVDVVGRLADRSLVSVDVDPRGAVRYRLLDSIRAFALARLQDAGLADTASAAHADWFADRAQRCAETVRGPAQADCLAFARSERANVDAALAWAATHRPATGLRIATGLGWVWVVLGDGVAGAQRLRGALAAAAGDASPREEAQALLLAGWLEASAGNVDRSRADLDAASRLAETLADERLRADVQRHQAFLHIQQGSPDEVLASAGAALTVYRARGLTWEIAGSLLLSAYGSIILGATGDAARSAAEALELLTPLEDSWGIVHAEATLATVAQAEQRFTEAARALARAAASSEELGFVGQAALHLTRLGRVQQRAGDLDASVGTLRRAVRAAHAGGDLRLAATARTHLARARRAAGEDVDARELLEEADRWYRSSGGGDGALLTRCLLLSVTATADPAGRVAELDDLLRRAADAHDLEVQVLARDALARHAVGRGDRARAGRLLADADAVAAVARHLLAEADRVDARTVRRAVAGGDVGQATT
ncbi:MAG: AfsR/SARP family transcriptional regulator [Kineosporiaceae bacterium]